MRIGLRAFWTGALLATLAAVAVPAQEREGRRDRRFDRVGITVFEHPNYRGRNATFRDAVSDLSDFHLNDRISSFRIARGELWEVCEHKDFQGRCAVFSGDEADLSRVSWNEMISSLRPVRRGDRRWDEREGFDRRSRPGAVLYEQRNFRGLARQLDRAEPELSDLGDGVSSINVRGRAWEICDRPHFAGRCVVISEDVPDLRSYDMEDRVASARPVRGDGDDFDAPPGAPYGPPDEPRLVLYERPDFRGRAREVNGSEEELSDFNDRAQSARAVRGVWQLCEHRNFGGRCVTISGDVRDLDTYRLRDAVTSARPLYGEPR